MVFPSVGETSSAAVPFLEFHYLDTASGIKAFADKIQSTINFFVTVTAEQGVFYTAVKKYRQAFESLDWDPPSCHPGAIEK